MDNFDIDDLESLQNAKINSDLLESHFINTQLEAKQVKQGLLSRHAKKFGFVKIPEFVMNKKKQSLVKKTNEEYRFK